VPAVVPAPPTVTETSTPVPALSINAATAPTAATTSTTTSATPVATSTFALTTATITAPTANEKKIEKLSNYLCKNNLTDEQRIKYKYDAIDKEIADVTAELQATLKRKAENASNGRGKRAKISLPMGWTAITTVRTTGKMA
jgi:hypothetical protein